MKLDEFKEQYPTYDWFGFETAIHDVNWNLFRWACSIQLKDPLREFLLIAAWILAGQDHGDYNIHDVEQLEELEDTLHYYGVY
jgi:hypothetical protein